MEIKKEDVFQAIVLMDTFNKNFTPVVKYNPLAFLTVAGVPLIEYVLQSLYVGGITEVILFCCQDATTIKNYVKENEGFWNQTMDIQVKSSDTCQSMGDVMREIDAASLIKGDFILLGINSITNINFAALLEQHKQTCKKDKGAAMTLVYKQLSWEHALIKSDKSVFLAADGKTNKVLVHQKFMPNCKDNIITLPTKHILSNSQVKLHHNLVDPNIAVCSPSVPPLFADNFDFQTRDDFIHGLLIQEDILTDSLYYTFASKFAAAVTNWKTYQTVCRAILHKWAYPLTIETGTSIKDFVDLGKHVFRDKTATLNRSCTLVEDVLIDKESILGDDTVVSKSIIGKYVTIGNNVTIENSYIMDKTVIKNNVRIINSFIDKECIIEENCNIENGTIVAQKIKLNEGTTLNGTILEKSDEKEIKLKKSTSESGTEWENESTGSGEDEFIGFNRTWSDSESCYSSDSSEDSILAGSPVQDDTKMFLQEVIDSLARGFDDKLKCDYLILEINSSRYAYNIQLHEVNFFVVRAILSLPVLTEAKTFLVTLRDVLKFFRPILANYIKSKSSIMDCLRAVEDSCIQCEWLNGNSGHILHMLYAQDVIDEDSLLEFYESMKTDDSPLLKQASVIKFFEWLEDASEESD